MSPMLGAKFISLLQHKKMLNLGIMDTHEINSTARSSNKSQVVTVGDVRALQEEEDAKPSHDVVFEMSYSCKGAVGENVQEEDGGITIQSSRAQGCYI
jgi:hypothetical protein